MSGVGTSGAGVVGAGFGTGGGSGAVGSSTSGSSGGSGSAAPPTIDNYFTRSGTGTIAPVITPYFSEPAAGVTITDYCGAYRATDPNTIATMGSMILYFATTATSATTTEHVTNCKKLFRGNAAATIVSLCAIPAAGDTSENAQNIRAILANGNNCVNWIIDLINAAKKKTLETSNTEGYFASLGNTAIKVGAITHMINGVQCFFPDFLLVDTSAMMRQLTPGIWTNYRISRVSAGSVLYKIREDFLALRIYAEGSATDLAIIACKDSPWDITLSLQIPEKVKAYGSIYLDAAGTPIDKWYQGIKAVNDMPSSKVRACKTVFKKYMELKNKMDDVESATEVSAMITAIPANFWN